MAGVNGVIFFDLCQPRQGFPHEFAVAAGQVRAAHATGEQSIAGEQNILAGTPFKGIAEAFSGWNSSQTGKVYARMPYEIVIR